MSIAKMKESEETEEIEEIEVTLIFRIGYKSLHEEKKKTKYGKTALLIYTVLVTHIRTHTHICAYIHATHIHTYTHICAYTCTTHIAFSYATRPRTDTLSQIERSKVR